MYWNIHLIIAYRLVFILLTHVVAQSPANGLISSQIVTSQLSTSSNSEFRCRAWRISLLYFSLPSWFHYQNFSPTKLFTYYSIYACFAIMNGLPDYENDLIGHHYKFLVVCKVRFVLRGYPLITLAWFWPLLNPPPPSLVVRMLPLQICQ